MVVRKTSKASMAKRFKNTHAFNGETYFNASSHHTKQSAIRERNDIKKHGHKSRITHHANREMWGKNCLIPFG